MIKEGMIPQRLRNIIYRDKQKESSGKMKMRHLLLCCMLGSLLPVCGEESGKEPDFRDYQLPQSSRIRENMEWTTFFATNLAAKNVPRALFIGDSICRDYMPSVAAGLRGTANCTQWTSSRCVTDPLYLQELEVFLSLAPHAVICFNNGLHSQFTNPAEYESAYRKAIQYLKAKNPGSKLFIILCTPVKDNYFNSIVLRMNKVAARIAAEEQIPVIDVYQALNRSECGKKWRDGVHFNAETNKELGKKISETVKPALPGTKKTDK